MTKVIIITVLLVVVTVALFLQFERNSYADYAFTGLHVQGNKMVNDSGQVFVPHGIDRSGTEYMCIQGNGIFDGPSDDASVKAMKSWGINTVHVLLNATCWLGKGGVQAQYGGVNYQNAIKQYVQTLENNQIYPVIVYMWDTQGHPEMPVAGTATDFWTSVADTFKTDNKVILHLQEEPHPGGGNTSATWKCWRDGGSSCNGITSSSVVGFQDLVNTVRATGAHNVIGLPGLQWSNIMDQFLTYLPTDPDNNLIALVDVYPDLNPCGNTNCYDTQYAPIIARMPLMAGEFGESVNGNICGVDQSNVFMNWMDQHNSGYLAWVWDTWGTSCGDLSLITDYAGTPHSPNGVNYKNHIAQFANQSPPIVSTAPTTAQTPPPNSCSQVIGDANGDGKVNLTDFEVWRRAFLAQSGGGATPTGVPTAHFSTLPPGSALPSESECAGRVRRSSWEPRPDNATANNTIPVAGQDYNIIDWTQFGMNQNANTLRARITGNFTGTTDEIIQWIACKWGIDEDIVRAQAQQESYWHMSQLGDQTSDATACSKIGQSAPCYQSYGILQVKSTVHTVTWPASKTSTAFNADYAYAYWRSCYEGWIDWLKGSSGYAAGDDWGCVGHWFSGDWHSSAADGYMNEVKQKYQNKIWTQPGF